MIPAAFLRTAVVERPARPGYFDPKLPLADGALRVNCWPIADLPDRVGNCLVTILWRHPPRFEAGILPMLQHKIRSLLSDWQDSWMGFGAAKSPAYFDAFVLGWKRRPPSLIRNHAQQRECYFSASAKPASPGATTETNTNGPCPVFVAPCTWPGNAMAMSPAFKREMTLSP